MPKKKERPLTLDLTAMEGRTSIVIQTPSGEYGSNDDVRAIAYMAELGALLDRLGLPFEAMYRRRLPDSPFGDKIVDRICIEASFLDLITGIAKDRT